jgi:hypothetical protein
MRACEYTATVSPKQEALLYQEFALRPDEWLRGALARSPRVPSPSNGLGGYIARVITFTESVEEGPMDKGKTVAAATGAPSEQPGNWGTPCQRASASTLARRFWI